MTELPPTIEAVAFALQHAPGIGAAGLRRLLLRMAREKIPAAEFARLTAAELRSRFALPEAAAAAFLQPPPRTLETWQKLAAQRVQVAVWGQPEYPQRLVSVLGDSAPPLLYWTGAQSLFDAPSVGFCGSRKASEKGLGVARECARLLAGRGVVSVSGYAQGVDLTAHAAALEAGGSTTIVLAEGILHFRVKETIRNLLDPSQLDRALVVSEFPPALPWKAHSAMTRNRT
ncbi:MAG TPA: DNA-processing protein DprA, partial [Chthoniobacteraceae bacterium]|nr:DNA-processing protein DprA [Chthoniobacteraceae bacterium]